MTIADFQCKLRYGWIGLFGLLAWLDSSQAQDPLDRHTAGNRLTYLDEPCDPYYVGQSFPKLITPQWVGEKRGRSGRDIGDRRHERPGSLRGVPKADSGST